MASVEQLGRVLNVGLIGCGEVSQVVHIQTLLPMASWFRITHLCDVSPSALEHYRAKIPGSGVKTTQKAEEICADEDVDIVMVTTADEYHIEHAILGLKHDKYGFLEKPCALTRRDNEAIIEVERKCKGSVMEIGGLDQILYARVRCKCLLYISPYFRNILLCQFNFVKTSSIGPNSVFVSQSGTFPKVFTDFSPEDAAGKTSRAEEMVKHALQTEIGGVEVNPETTLMWRVLAGLGSHDLSVMREALGMPEKVVGTSLGFPFWNALFKYPNFTVSYESGIDNIPRFDALFEVYSANKAVRIQYETPYVKGLPVTMHIAANCDGAYKETTERRSYEDPYTLEMKELWNLVAEGKPVKTTISNAFKDIKLFGMIMAHGYKA
ncbi:hypothetical protein jhhlp_006979 [Lomentospora prolificans]|uniref:Gfo/Idh/MocA-like oxidoreductase N-terminal domain-containing protein n=1 Tax=Lomentospora prolificans TaxID=41688 RepID=A0A2N3N1D2_9PEZI|nr:hypothetical protein jhhlp_006979 [Lomentospora prolificans]